MRAPLTSVTTRWLAAWTLALAACGARTALESSSSPDAPVAAQVDAAVASADAAVGPVDAAVVPLDAPADLDTPPARGSCRGSGPRLVVLEDADPGAVPPRHLDRVAVYSIAGPSAVLLCERTDLAILEMWGATHALAAAPAGDPIVVAQLGSPSFFELFGSDDLREHVLTGGADYLQGVQVLSDRVVAEGNRGDLSLGWVETMAADGSTSGRQPGEAADLVVDEVRGVVWSVGARLQRARLDDLAAPTVVATYGWAAVSIDLDLDGSVWVADVDYPAGPGRLVHYDASGALLATIPVDGRPACVRVHRRTGEVWATLDGSVVRVDRAGALQGIAARIRPPNQLGWWGLAPDHDTDGAWVSYAHDAEAVLLAPDGTIVRSVPVAPTAGQRHLLVIPP